MKDIHKQKASELFNIPIEEVTEEQRQAAKTYNFGFIYGLNNQSLNKILKDGNKTNIR